MTSNTTRRQLLATVASAAAGAAIPTVAKGATPGEAEAESKLAAIWAAYLKWRDVDNQVALDQWADAEGRMMAVSRATGKPLAEIEEWPEFVAARAAWDESCVGEDQLWAMAAAIPATTFRLLGLKVALLMGSGAEQATGSDAAIDLWNSIEVDAFRAAGLPLPPTA